MDYSLCSLFSQGNDKGYKQSTYYFSKSLNVKAQKYSDVEKLCLTLSSTAVKLRHYLLPFEALVIARIDLIKYILTRPLLRGKLGKWIVALIEYSLTYIPQKAVKGQVLARFLADHPNKDTKEEELYVGIVPWKMMFDGSETSDGAGARVVFLSPVGFIHQFAFQITKDCSNNQAEYEALIIGLEMLLEMHVMYVHIFGDSQLVVKQINGKFKCCAVGLEINFSYAMYLLNKFDDAIITHVPRIENGDANLMAQLASRQLIPSELLNTGLKYLDNFHQLVRGTNKSK
ncbi:hypothetical protein RJ640_025117 [Escallonia rubra]|uniref:RNase H type-1 domain-containing protein n=1 Tax=Escallonia rubra TaxID=112253 RepID=A0AA88UNH5_9ASTE|nr:hypothetical protein RJ640_025117 [Escallonia rubra]